MPWHELELLSPVHACVYSRQNERIVLWTIWRKIALMWLRNVGNVKRKRFHELQPSPVLPQDLPKAFGSCAKQAKQADAPDGSQAP